MPRRVRQLLPWAGFLAAYLALQLFIGYHGPTESPPTLAGTNMSGTAFDLSQLRGRPALIYFWASWCGICRGMQHNIVALDQDHPVITVAMQSGNVSEVVRYQDEHDFHPPTLLDPDGDLAHQYGVRGVPAIFVLDPNGQIRFSSAGYQTEAGMRLRLWLAGWLDRF